MKFTLHDQKTAPEASRPLLQQVEDIYGFVPNIYAVFAESPVAISTYLHINAQLKQHGALTPGEQQIVMLAVSESNGCEYCVAAHSMVAGMAHVPAEVVRTIREGQLPEDPKFAALVRFAKAGADSKGRWAADEIAHFEAAGYDNRHALEILSILALKTLSNYTNHLANPPLDEAFASHQRQAA